MNKCILFIKTKSHNSEHDSVAIKLLNEMYPVHHYTDPSIPKKKLEADHFRLSKYSTGNDFVKDH